MPEIVEVEIVARQLSKLLTNSVIVGGKSLHPKFERFSVKGKLLSPIPTGRLTKLFRHGKWIILLIQDATAKRAVRLNLGMSGRFALVNGPKEFKHIRWYIKIVNQGKIQTLAFIDPRCMGHLISESWAVAREAVSPMSASRGIPEFGLGPDCFAPVFGKHSAAYRQLALMKQVLDSNRGVKQVLLDQTRLAGLGNIYANELCFAMRAHPEQPANLVNQRQMHRFLGHLPKLLRASLVAGGTSFGDANTFLDLWGTPGRNSKNLFVYGRHGQACLICGTKIIRIKGKGQSSFFCPTCQGSPT